LTYNNPWRYKGEIFDSDKIQDHYGFVYLITNLANEKKYIGKKFFWTSKTRQVNKKVKKYKAESNWQSYYGSNDKLAADIDIEGEALFKREILVLCKTKGAAGYFEAKLQFETDCILKDEFYNTWIMVRVRSNHLKGVCLNSAF